MSNDNLVQRVQEGVYKVNMDGVSAFGGSDVIPEGHYVMISQDTKFQMSKNERPMYVTELKVLEPTKHKGKRVTEFFVLTDKALGKLKNFFEAAGFEIDAEVELQPARFDGHTVGAQVTNREYQGNTRSQVRRFLDAGQARDEITSDKDEVEVPPPSGPLTDSDDGSGGETLTPGSTSGDGDEAAEQADSEQAKESVKQSLSDLE